MAALLTGVAIALPWGTWRMWWGGQCPPGRFLVVLVPILALGVAARVAEDGDVARGLLRWRAVLLAAGLGLALFMVARPGELMLLNRADRPTRVWAARSGDVPLERYLPSLVAPDAPEWKVAALWLAALAVVIGLDRWSRRNERPDRLFGGLALPVAMAVLIGLLVDSWARP